MTSGNVKIVKIVPLPHARSDVWQYFGFIADDDGEIRDKKKAICKICATTLAYSGNTTNLFTHLKAMHPEAQPRKMDPTNRTPKSRRRSCKRNIFGLDDDGVYDNTITLGSGATPMYFVKALAYAGNESGSSTASLLDNVVEVAAATDNLNNNNSGSVSTNNVSESNGEVSDHMNVIPSDEMSVPTSSNPPNSSPSCENVPLISYDDITNAIVNMLVEDCRPVCVTQGKGFQKLISLLVPSYKVPHSGELKPLIRRQHKEMQRNLILRGFEDEMVK